MANQPVEAAGACYKRKATSSGGYKRKGYNNQNKIKRKEFR
jgi:hypothetical protein